MKYLYFLILISSFSFAQNDKLLKVINTKENVVSSAIEGAWKSKEIRYFKEVKFTNDPSVLEAISVLYYDNFKNLKIYFAGNMEITLKLEQTNREEKYICPFFITEHNGNPHLVFFRERDKNPIGDTESFILFIAISDHKNQDRLFIGGDFNNQAFYEYERIAN